MRKKLKRLLTLGLAVVITFHPICVSANEFDNSETRVFEEETEVSQPFSGAGEGTKSNPYQITNFTQLDEIRYNMEAYYQLVNDIDMSSINNWIPIGNEESSFNGNFDGQNYTIKNLTIKSNYLVFSGLFGACDEHATIKNLNLEKTLIDLDIDTHDSSYYVHVGTVAARAENVTNCSVTGTISVVNNTNADVVVGGIVGFGRAPSNCVNKATIYVESNSSIECGGIVGMPGAVFGKIVDCKNYGNITAIAKDSFNDCGGISGTEGSIKRCENYGNIYGETTEYNSYSSFAGNCNVGGIVGATSGETSYSFNYGNIGSYAQKGGSSYAGGIAGFNGYYSDGVIKNCINVGKSINSTAQRKNNNIYIDSEGNAGRIVAGIGTYRDIPIEDCYSLNETTLNNNIPTENIGTTSINGASLSTDELQYAIENNYVGNSKILSTFPENGEVQVNPQLYGTGYDVTVCFDGVVTSGDGDVRIINLDTGDVRYYDTSYSSDVHLEESVLTISNVQLEYNTKYSIQFDDGCVFVDGKIFFGLSKESDWTFTTKEKIRYIEDTWGFSNPTSKISVNSYKKFFEPAVAKSLQKSNNGTGGHCAGMAITSMASYLGYPQITSYGSYGNLNALEKSTKSSETNCKAIDYIDCAFTYQFTEAFVEAKNSTKNNYSGLYNAVSNFEKNNAEPVYISIGTKSGGHALMGLKIAEETDNTTKILVYDCNHPNEKCYLVLEGRRGNYTGWSYNLSNQLVWNSTQDGARVNYVTMASNFISDYKANSIDDKQSFLMTISKWAGGIFNYNGEQLSIDDMSTLSSKNIIPIQTDTAINNSEYDNYWLSNTDTVVSWNSLSADAEVSLAKNNLEMTAKSSAISDISFDMDTKCVKVIGDESSTFEINYECSDTYNESDVANIVGVSNGTVETKQNDDENIIVSGVKECIISASDKNESDDGNSLIDNSNVIKLSNMDDENTYQICITENNEIEVFEDTNGDGKYDKSVVSSSKPSVIPTIKPDNQPIETSKPNQPTILPTETSKPNQPTVLPTESPTLPESVAIGTKTTVGKMKYKVTKVNNNGAGEVTLIGTTRKKSDKRFTTLKIGNTVKIKGKSFKITEIGNNAFRGYRKLKSVTVGKNVKKIGSKAFYGCKKLNKIVIKTKHLQAKKVGDKAFKGIYSKVNIKVPKPKLKSYKKILRAKGVGKHAKIHT